MIIRLLGLVVGILLIATCTPGADKDVSGGARDGSAGSLTAQSMSASGPADPAQIARGEELFQMKGCAACHTIGGGKLTGPDLVGVTARRPRPWIVAMMTTPDSMLRHDPEAKKLLAEYMTPMANMNVTVDEAQALYAFLHSKTP